jgi:hypothetical protein
MHLWTARKREGRKLLESENITYANCIQSMFPFSFPDRLYAHMHKAFGKRDWKRKLKGNIGESHGQVDHNNK